MRLVQSAGARTSPSASLCGLHQGQMVTGNHSVPLLHIPRLLHSVTARSEAGICGGSPVQQNLSVLQRKNRVKETTNPLPSHLKLGEAPGRRGGS